MTNEANYTFAIVGRVFVRLSIPQKLRHCRCSQHTLRASGIGQCTQDVHCLRLLCQTGLGTPIPHPRMQFRATDVDFPSFILSI